MNIKALTRHFAVLAFAMLAPVQASAYDFEVDGIYYDAISIEDLTAAVTHGENEYSGNVVIPSTVVFRGRTFDVVAIGSNAFYECGSLKSVEIPNGVTSIGESAFEDCTSLASVVIPNGVTSIGESAFTACRSLASVEIPNSVTSIGEYAFNACSSLASVVIPNSVTSIGESAFVDCTSLASVVIPNGVTSIGEYAFDGCTSLASVEIPNSVTEIGNLAFFGCTHLSSFVLGSGVNSWKSDLYKRYSGGVFYYYYRGVFTSEEYPRDIVLEKLHIVDSDTPLKMEEFHLDYPSSYDYEFCDLPLKEVYLGRKLVDSSGNPIMRSSRVFATGIEKVELGGNLTNDDMANYFADLNDVKTIIYGEHIEEISHPCEAATAIYLRSATPPVTVEWSNYNYINAVLYVPQGSIAAYQSADVWKNFWEIREWDATTGIASPVAGNEPEVSVSGRQITVSTGGQGVPVRVYNASGSLLYDGGEGTVSVAAPGLYIVRAGNHSEKLLVK